MKVPDFRGRSPLMRCANTIGSPFLNGNCSTRRAQLCQTKESIWKAAGVGASDFFKEGAPLARGARGWPGAMG